MTLSRSYDNSSGQSLDLSEWKGAYVTVDALQMGSPIEADGEVTQANPMLMILDRGKGKNPLMIEAREIKLLKEIPRPVIVPKITVRTLAAVDEGTVRQHIADRHGWLIGKIHDDPKVAMQFHDLAHAEGQLGHKHDAAVEVALTTDEVERRARELDRDHGLMLECLSCGYYRGPSEEGRSMHQVNGKLDDDGQPAYHCEGCKDDKEFNYS